MSTNLHIDNSSIVQLSLAVTYLSEQGEHHDLMHFEKFNVWRDGDFLPAEIQSALMGQQAGYKQRFHFSAGQLTGEFRQDLIYKIRNQDFNRRPRKNLVIEPRCGRFYPKGWFAGIPGNFSENMSPARLVELQEDSISVDFNHPLARHNVSIDVEVFDVSRNVGEHGGRCNDCIAELLAGPGMQLPYQHVTTDYFTDHAFSRGDQALDGLFYAMPRMVDHLDATALQQLQTFYAKVLPPQASILDLMSSINSHLPNNLQTRYVAGLGMNQQELAANPRLDECFIHDVNDDTVLPFDDASFDVVLCSVSVEYLTRPLDSFREVARVLKPGGLFICSFSNRWFPTKAIQLWTELHEFERMGLVMEYFVQSGLFENIDSWSLRGLPRPEDDRHRLPLSDPLYAVWGSKV